MQASKRTMKTYRLMNFVGAFERLLKQLLTTSTAQADKSSLPRTNVCRYKVPCHQCHKVSRNWVFHVELIGALFFLIGALGSTHQHLHTCRSLGNKQRAVRMLYGPRRLIAGLHNTQLPSLHIPAS